MERESHAKVPVDTRDWGLIVRMMFKVKCFRYHELRRLINSFWLRVILILLPVLIFYPMLDNGFASKAGDDNWMVYGNFQVYSLQIENVWNYFTSFFHGQYSPVNTLFYGVIYYFFGMDPYWYHFFCLFVHILNVLLVYTFVNYLLNLSFKDEPVLPSKLRNVSFFTALLFAIHPMQVESVAWISASKILIYSSFFIISLLCYLRYVETCKKRFYFLSLLVFIISFGAKEQAVVLPLCLLLVDYYVRRASILKRTLLFEKIPFLLCALLLGVVELIAQETEFTYKLENEYYPFWQRLVFASFSVTQYLIQLLVPTNLSHWYEFPMRPGESLDVRFFFYPLVIAAVIYYLFIFIRLNQTHLVFGVGFLIANIFLALHIIPMARGVIMADRYVYLGSLGYFFALAFFIVESFKRMSPPHYLYRGILIIYILYLAYYSFRYSDTWT